MTDSTERIVERFFDVFMPQLEICGRYALSLQQRISSREEKSGDAWTSALTDADLGVQHYLEAFVLAQCPGWHLHGEEYEQSFNTPYLPIDAEVQLMLDPINGTRLYRDGADGFDILLSMAINRQLVATMSYMPARGMFYCASRKSGAFSVHAGASMSCSSMADFAANMTLAAYQAEAWMSKLPGSVQVFDVSSDYSAHDPRCCMNSLFTGELGGFLFGDCALLDVGATAFTASQAGGIATLPDGSGFDYFEHFDPERRGDLLVCTNAALHDAVTQALSATK